MDMKNIAKLRDGVPQSIAVVPLLRLFLIYIFSKSVEM